MYKRQKFQQEFNKLNGTWVPVQQKLVAQYFQKQPSKNKRLSLTIAIITAESVDKGVVKYANNKMDIYGKESVVKL